MRKSREIEVGKLFTPCHVIWHEFVVVSFTKLIILAKIVLSWIYQSAPMNQGRSKMETPTQLGVVSLKMKAFCLSVILAVIIFFGIKVAFPEVDFSWFYQSAPRIQGRFSNVIVFSGKNCLKLLWKVTPFLCHVIG